MPETAFRLKMFSPLKCILLTDHCTIRLRPSNIKLAETNTAKLEYFRAYISYMSI